MGYERRKKEELPGAGKLKIRVEIRSLRLEDHPRSSLRLCRGEEVSRRYRLRLHVGKGDKEDGVTGDE